MCVQSATHVFVVCLAVSDLALCLFSLPVQLHYQLTDNWFLGSALCRVIFAAFAVPMYLSTVTIMLIAVDRCVARAPLASICRGFVAQHAAQAVSTQP